MRTIIIYAEQGKGKTRNAERLKEHFGCVGVEDDWRVGEPIIRGTLVLTNDDAVLEMPLPPNADLLRLDAALSLMEGRPRG
ncbi:MAG: hypothetical protein V7756_04795 [Halopseudomonas sp.]|uniref:hypothetical protein n=1 Tax=Halopseudomonas sp. TaxID=2901191 RepID=UPI0030039F3E